MKYLRNYQFQSSQTSKCFESVSSSESSSSPTFPPISESRVVGLPSHRRAGSSKSMTSASGFIYSAFILSSSFLLFNEKFLTVDNIHALCKAIQRIAYKLAIQIIHFGGTANGNFLQRFICNNLSDTSSISILIK